MTADYPIPLSGALIEKYAARGFVVTPDVLSSLEIKEFGAAVDLEVARRGASDKRAVSEKNTYEQSFIQCMRLWETSTSVRPLTCHTGLAGIASQLMRVSSVRLWQDQALYKEAGGRETTPHQDQTFWPIGYEPLVSAWIPFDDVLLGNGAMSYVPGSHRAGRLKVVDITHSTDPYAILDDPALRGRKPECVEVKSGSVIWHHGLMVHQASANFSRVTRRVFTIVYISADARRSRPWPAYPLDRENIKVGEGLRGDSMPVLWPAPGSLPVPPALVGDQVGPQYQISEKPKLPG